MLHFYALTFPLATLEDESSHIVRGMIILEVLNIVPLWAWFILTILTIASLFLLYKLYKKDVNLFIAVLLPLSIAYYYIVCHVASRFLINQFGSLDIINQLWLIRYGSLSAIVYALQLILFGYREWGMRLFPVIFSVFSAVYLYKLISLYKNENWALFSSISFLFLPGIFYFVNISQLSMGVTLFTILSIYFLMRFTLKNEKKDLAYMCLFLILGFQYKEIFLLTYGTIFGYLIYFYLFIKKKIDYLSIVKYLSLSLIPTLIWLVTQGYFNNSTNFMSSRFLAFNQNLAHNVFRYITTFPSEATWPISILFFIGLPFALYSIFKKKDELAVVFMTHFLIIYSFITFDSLNHYDIVYRYAADLLLSISFLSFFSINLIKRRKLIKLISYGLIIFLMITSTFLTYHNWENRFVPMDGTFSYIKENIPESEKILRTMAPNPYKFYIAKYEIKNEMRHIVWANVSEQDIASLFAFMEKNNYTYYIFPKPSPSYHSYWPNDFSWVYTTGLIREPVLNETLLNNLMINNTYFSVVYNDNLGDNSLYIIKKAD